MRFNTEFPKHETTLITTKQEGNLSLSASVVVHYRNYKGFEDSVDHYTITGDRNAWYEIKQKFNYDYLMGAVKDAYTDSFKRVMNVSKINEIL